jgi:hypothetical protein
MRMLRLVIDKYVCVYVCVHMGYTDNMWHYLPLRTFDKNKLKTRSCASDSNIVEVNVFLVTSLFVCSLYRLYKCVFVEQKNYPSDGRVETEIKSVTDV